MRKLTHSEFRTMIESRKGTNIVSFHSETDARCRKTGNPHFPIFKRSYVNGIIGYSYENSVNLQRAREGMDDDFQAESRAWGVRVSPAFVVHTAKPTKNNPEPKERLYLTVKIERVLSEPEYFEKNTGNVLSFLEQVKPFLPAKRQSERQGTDKEIIHREYSLDSIINLRVNGEDIELVNE